MGMKESRISRIFNPETGRAVIIPIDHGLFMGSLEGLKAPFDIAEKLVEARIDATLMSFGMAKLTKELFNRKNAPSKILTADFILLSNIPGNVDGILGYDAISSVEQAVKWGFDAVKVLLAWGTNGKILMDNIRSIGKFARECDKWDMPLMIEPVLWGRDVPDDKRDDPILIEHACRIAVELGADILKAPYTGDKESFARIVSNSHVPVVILGGPKMSNIRDVLQTAKDSLDAGGRGVVFGRNVWQHPEMEKVLMALKDIVHTNKDVDNVIKDHGLRE